MNRTKAIVTILFLISPLSACIAGPRPTTYNSVPIEAWVVDAESGKPVEGAVVLARWEMYLDGQEGYEANNDRTATIKIVETTTDSTGRFVFPGWGPESICCGFLDGHDPQIFIFKPGYKGIIESDSYSAVIDDPKVRNPYWNGKKFNLDPYAGNYQGEKGKGDFNGFERFADGQISLGFLTLKSDMCMWKSVPGFLAMVQTQVHTFVSHGYEDGRSIISYLLDNDDSSSDIYRKCGSTKEFLSGIEKRNRGQVL